MKTLVTGGAGFIGSHLVDRLLNAGQDVIVLDNLSTGREENLSSVRGHPRFKFVHGSILDDTLVGEVMRDVELVFHLAAAVGVKHVVEDPLWTMVTNTRGTEIIVEKAAARGVRLVFASTSEIYGISEALPFEEDGQRVLGPTWTHRWSYSTSKALDEHLCFAHAARGLEMSIVRYFNIYGPRMDPKGYGSVIAKFIGQALAGRSLSVHGDGQQTRCFTYVDEAVEATMTAGLAKEALGQVYNVGSGFEISIRDLAAEIIRISGSDSEIENIPYEIAYGKGFSDTRRRVPAVEKIERELGWRAKVDLAEGLGQVIDEQRRLARANSAAAGGVED